MTFACSTLATKEKQMWTHTHLKKIALAIYHQILHFLDKISNHKVLIKINIAVCCHSYFLSIYIKQNFPFLYIYIRQTFWSQNSPKGLQYLQAHSFDYKVARFDHQHQVCVAVCRKREETVEIDHHGDTDRLARCTISRNHFIYNLLK